MAVGETFVLKKAVEMGGVTIFKALKFGLIFLAIAFICYGVYKAYFLKPEPTRIENVEEKTEVNIIKRDKILGIGVEVFGYKLGFYKDYKDAIPAIAQ